MLWGEMDAMAEDTGEQPIAGAPKHAAVWKSWQDKFGNSSATARAIEVLLLHGKMKREALKIHLKCGNSTLTDTIYKLNKADLIVKDGSYLSLKQL